jgi:hypothetical protein
LVNAAILCGDCHTPQDSKGKPDRARLLRGAELPIRPKKETEDWADMAPDITSRGLAEKWGEKAMVKFLMPSAFDANKGMGRSTQRVIPLFACAPNGNFPAPDDTTIMIWWEGQDRVAFAGQWFLHLDGLPGITRQVQFQAAQAELAAAGVESDIQAIDHARSDGNLLLQVPDDMTYYQLLAAVRNLPGFQYVEPFFADDGGQRTVFWTQDQGDGGNSAGGPGAPPAPPVSNINGFDGINAAGSNGPWSPPDTVGAVGPSSFIEAVNTTIEIFSKTGAAIAAPKNLNAFFNLGTTFAGDPLVIYDELAGHFFVSDTEFNNNKLDVAISKTANPTTRS